MILESLAGETEGQRRTTREVEHVSGRETLRDARREAGMTQRQVAEAIGVSERYYRMIEQGARTGDFEIWDQLEDLFGIHQRKLREVG